MVDINFSANGALRPIHFRNDEPQVKAGDVTMSAEKITPSPNPTSNRVPAIALNYKEQVSSPPAGRLVDTFERKQIDETQPAAAPELDSLPRQIRDVTQQQSQVESRQQNLRNEREEIDQQIRQLQQQEQELNRKKSQLTKEASLGTVINLSV